MISTCLALAALLTAAPVQDAPERGPDTAEAGSIPVLGVLQLDAPTTGRSILRGTLPLPPGSYLPGVDSPYPLVLRMPNGSLVLPQVDVVARYAATSDGASVVRLLAPVEFGEESVPGDILRVQVLPGAAFDTEALLPGVPPVFGGASVLDEIQLTPKIEELILRANSLVGMVVDPFKNLYTGTLIGLGSDFGAIGAFELLDHGHVAIESKRYLTMTLSPNSANNEGEPLPHHFGVHVYTRAYAGFDFLTLDLRYSNGASDLDPNSTLDDALGDVYFRELNLVTPAGWKILSAYQDQTFGERVVLPSGLGVTPLASNPDNGKFHVLPLNGQLHRRLALVPDNDPQAEAEARAHLALEGYGIALGGGGPEAPQFSWTSELTPAFFPQLGRLPHLDHLGLDFVRDKVATKSAELLTNLANGTAAFPPLVSGAVGWAHPFGQKYGGITGGGGINLYDAISEVYAGSAAGLQYFQVLHRMKSDRQRNVIYNFNGQPPTVDERLVQGPNGPYFPGFFYMQPLPSHDPFNYDKASTLQVDYVLNNGLADAGALELPDFQAIDLQHLIRYTRAPKTLAWLTGDALSVDDVLAQSALVKLSYHKYPGTIGGSVQTTGMLDDINFTNAQPGKGFTYNRGDGWGLDTMASAYALGTPAWRTENREWFDDVVEIVRRGQATCSGFIQAQYGSKLLDGKYRGRQTYEGAIIDHALMGVMCSVYKNTGAPESDTLKDVLRKSLYALVDPFTWDEVRNAPHEQVAVGPLDETLPIYCSGPPADGLSLNSWDLYQSWSSFAYGFELTGDAVFLSRAEQMIGSTDLLGQLELGYLNNLENRAALMSLLQDM